jgi:hypothetical protein
VSTDPRQSTIVPTPVVVVVCERYFKKREKERRIGSEVKQEKKKLSVVGQTNKQTNINVPRIALDQCGHYPYVRTLNLN